MCLAAYIAASVPLKLIEWEKAEPNFHVAELSSRDSHVKKQFALSHVYYVGSHEGCGCGFLKDGEVGEDLKRVEESYARLADYAREALEAGAELQLFSCWEGDQGAAPEFHEVISVETLKESDFVFKEKAFYRLLM
jgi:hypothetical protein